MPTMTIAPPTTGAAGTPGHPAGRPHRRIGFAVRGLRSAGFGAFIGVALHLAFGFPLVSGLVHSVCIAIACWAAIDALRVGAARLVRRGREQTAAERADWPGWAWMLPVIGIGTVAGFTVGNAVAGWITGHHSPGFFRGSWSQAASLLVLALVPGIVITYWFYSRETLAAQAAAVVDAQRLAAEHQLKLLESQLEPHMLFNTLANLRVLIDIDPPRAQAMLDRLIAFLRAMLTGSRGTLHPLRAEFARLADYLALMQVRMGPRLETGFTLPDALAECPVPPLLLQPLVENCIRHGLEPIVGGGRIDIAAARDGGTLILTVRDTGAGLAAPLTDASAGSAFGLTQVRERLAALYGAAASLELQPVDAAAGGGTRATLRLPLTVPASPAAGAAR
jgi:signal transduction histidine kinase